MTPASDDARLLQTVDGAMAGAAQRCGALLACRPACTECCVGPFPINALDAERLARGLVELGARDPARAAAVRARAADGAGRLLPGLPAALGGTGDSGEAEEEAFLARHAALPCPALDPGTGLCDLYAHRPIACRTFGPPMRIEGTDLPPCRLCFVGASPAEVDSRRTVLEVAAAESPLTASAVRAGFPDATLIALVLARP